MSRIVAANVSRMKSSPYRPTLSSDNRKQDRQRLVDRREEAVQMIKFQRAYEANARFFSTVDQTLSILFSIVGR